MLAHHHLQVAHTHPPNEAEGMEILDTRGAGKMIAEATGGARGQEVLM